ncbi:signal peptidase I [Thalassoroseus pseudoceratinae]|uniref:signal peptidase I n=1 Tax=Thalassoroseus pseudoceratinae TaxID=2713176 RepID=UPI001981C930|nr:signal peptidase I [Thalassoroseus pseudoceratinae]
MAKAHPTSTPSGSGTTSGQQSEKSADSEDTQKSKSGELRETMESIVVAFILAFLFRTFEAEAFVIPTGSMAPTLRGRHKEADCPQCGHHVVVGASAEVNNDGYLYGRKSPNGLIEGTRRIHDVVCDNCRYRFSMYDKPAFKGDRILVNKFPFELRGPDRWDVIVFKYPEKPTTNYIKRLVGLPGEKIRIQQGDVYVNDADDGPLRILRKDDPDKQRELQILVYDNNHSSEALRAVGWPERWGGMTRGDDGRAIAGWIDDPTGWKMDPVDRSFVVDATDGQATLRYRHFVPQQSDWQAIADSGDNLQFEWRTPPGLADRDFGGDESSENVINLRERLKLVTDYCGYNAFTLEEYGNHDGEGHFWVGDLTVSMDVVVESANDGAELLLELIEGRRRYRCRIDLSNGKATLYYPDDQSRDESEVVTLGFAETDVIGTGAWEITYANVDDRVCLWIDGDLVEFESAGEVELVDGEQVGAYHPVGGLRTRTVPTEADLSPVGVTVQNAVAKVSNLLLERDIYYRADLFVGEKESTSNVRDLDFLQSQPEQWFDLYRDLVGEAIEFDRLDEDEFFAMGDNSPQSMDSRLWPFDRDWMLPGDRRPLNRHAVPRSALVGKAFFIYWPHGVPFGNDGNGWGIRDHRAVKDNGDHFPSGGAIGKTDYPSFRVPFYPDLFRMKRIR